MEESSEEGCVNGDKTSPDTAMNVNCNRVNGDGSEPEKIAILDAGAQYGKVLYKWSVTKSNTKQSDQSLFCSSIYILQYLIIL